MTSICKRPIDLVIVVSLFSFVLIAATIGEPCRQLARSSMGGAQIDDMSTYDLIIADYTQVFDGSICSKGDAEMLQSVWPPPQVLKAYTWWCKTYDPLLARNPLW